MEIIERAFASGEGALDENAAKTILSNLGISVPRGIVLDKGHSGAEALSRLKPPYVLKALSSEAIHKSEIGAVRLNLDDAESVDRAMEEIRAQMAKADFPLTGFLLEEMVAPGHEIIIGGTIDATFGPMLMLGAGGIFAEIFQDVAFRLCPVDRRDAREMLEDLKMAPILKGARGREAVDLDLIVNALVVLGGEDGFFTNNYHWLREFDLNPLICGPNSLIAVDSRMVLGKGRK
ncbi:MAG: acetate--CoA ligase family protein [Rhizobiaceae bacterium]